uniref:Uncharacterized protein n=1 Tax=Oryza punctata TaxID=4537 RepID=A0A0E0JF72_ORYPU
MWTSSYIMLTIILVRGEDEGSNSMRHEEDIRH